MHIRRRARALLLITVSAVLAAAACTDARDPVAPAAPAAVPPSGQPTKPKNPVKLKRIMIPGPFTIEGPPAPYSIEIENGGSAAANLLLRTEIIQDAGYREVGDFPVACPSPDGSLPVGVCTMALTATVSNSNPGSGTLLPGFANLRVTLFEDQGGGSLLFVADRKIGVDLVSAYQPPYISDLQFDIDELAIGGPSQVYLVSMTNPNADPVSEIFIQGVIRQGAVERGAGGYDAFCAPDFVDAVLPPGTCTMSPTVSALATVGLDGALQPGPAEFVLTLYQGFVDPEPLDERTVPVSLVPGGPWIAGVAVASNTIVIDDGPVDFTATIENPGPPASDLWLWIEFHQGASWKSGGAVIAGCPFGSPLPTGSCDVSGILRAHNPATGAGTLVAGPAEAVFLLKDGATVISEYRVDIVLEEPTPEIVEVSLLSSTLEIGGPATTWTAEVYNPSAYSQGGFTMQTYFRQGALENPGGGVIAHCPLADGILPPGSCVMSGSTHVENSFDTLVPGDAEFVLVLFQTVSGATIRVDERTLPVTLVDPT